jgi:hypothetical protein
LANFSTTRPLISTPVALEASKVVGAARFNDVAAPVVTRLILSALWSKNNSPAERLSRLITCHRFRSAKNTSFAYWQPVYVDGRQRPLGLNC